MNNLYAQLRVRCVHSCLSTDDILPARYKHSFTAPLDLAPHVFENALPGFAATLRPGDILLADDTFGIGSSREQAVSALLAAGVVGVLAPSFGRIFFRNAWNLGLLAIEYNKLPLEEGELITIDLEAGLITGRLGQWTFNKPPPEILAMIAAGGLLPWLRQQLEQNG